MIGQPARMIMRGPVTPRTSGSAADRRLASAVLAVTYALEVGVGPCMMVRSVGAHAAHYVSTDSRWLVARPLALQLIDDVLGTEGVAACASPDGWKDGKDLVTSSHHQILHPGCSRFHLLRGPLQGRVLLLPGRQRSVGA